MKLYTISLLVSCALAMTTTPAAIAGSFSSPFTEHGIVNPRIATSMPTFKQKTVPHHFKKKTAPHYQHWRHGFFLFPYAMSDQDTKQTKSRTSPMPAQKAYKQPIALDPAIFNPEPKTPLTLVIQDGVVVDRYPGY